MNFGELLRKRREDLGFTQDILAVKAGISKPYLSNIETGRAKNPPTDSVLMSLESALMLESGELLKLAHLARTPLDVRQEHEMLSAENSKLRNIVRKLMEENPDKLLEELSESATIEDNIKIAAGCVIPIINNVSAGYPTVFTDLDYPASIADEYIRCPDINDPQAFAARVVGDSMEPKYHEGDIVVFSPNNSPAAGDDCFIRFNDDKGTTFKRFYQDNPETIRLQPLNSEYPAQMYPTEQINGIWPAVYKIESLKK